MNAETVVVKHCYTIAGRMLGVEGEDPGTLREADTFLREYHLKTVGNQLAANRIDCLIRLRQKSECPCFDLGKLNSFDLGHGRCYVNGDDYFIEIDDSVIHTQPRKSIVDLFFADDSQTLSSTVKARSERINILSYAFQSALRLCGLYVLHAAGVSAPDLNVCALIIGNSGSGKSTLTLQLAREGWRYLSDDIMLLSEATNDEVSAYGLRRAFTITAAAPDLHDWAQLEDVLGIPVQSDPTKRWVEPEQLFPGNLIESCVPRMLLFPEITHERESRLRPLSKSEAMMRLVMYCPWARYDSFIARAYLGSLSRLVNQSTSYIFSAGLDVLEDSRSVANLLMRQTNTRTSV